MDNNNPNPVSANPVQPAAPQAPIPAPSPNGSNKAVLWFVMGLVIVVLLTGGIYLFLSKQQAKTADQAVRQPVVQNTPKPEDTIDALDKDLSAVNAEVNSDFASIDQDLRQL